MRSPPAQQRASLSLFLGMTSVTCCSWMCCCVPTRRDRFDVGALYSGWTDAACCVLRKWDNHHTHALVVHSARLRTSWSRDSQHSRRLEYIARYIGTSPQFDATLADDLQDPPLKHGNGKVSLSFHCADGRSTAFFAPHPAEKIFTSCLPAVRLLMTAHRGAVEANKECMHTTSGGIDSSVYDDDGK